MHLKNVFSIFYIAITANASPVITPSPQATHVVRDAYPGKDFSIAPVSIAPVSIAPVSIAPVSVAIPTCTMTAIPDKNGYVPPDTCNSLYEYYPSFNAAIAFTILFGILTALHIAQAVKHKKKFCWVICMAASWETIGFFTRTLSTRNQQSSGLVLVSQLFTLLAPLWVNAFDYMLFARMVHLFLPSKSIWGVRAQTLATIFVGLDIVSFMVQLVGGFMAGPDVPEDQLMKGIHVYMGGIGLQEAFIVCFLALVVRFHMIVGKGDVKADSPTWNLGGRKLLYTLYASLALITTRIIYRLVEHSSPPSPSNSLLYDEWYLYVFDATPMLIAIGLMNFTHPGTVLKGPESELPKCKCCCARKRRAKSSHYVEIAELRSKGVVV